MTVAKLALGQAGLPTPNSTKSFWHTQPSQTLLGHRTTKCLPAEADLVIVGSGLCGTSAAHFIRGDEAGRKLKVVMLEAREACWGATGRNGGHCQPVVYGSPPEIRAFEMRNYLHIKELVAKNEIPCEWRTLSVAHAYTNQELFEHRVTEFENALNQSPEISTLVSVIGKESTSPSLGDLRIPDASGAFLQKHAASLWPYKLVSWMLEKLLRENSDASSPEFNLQTNTAATHLQEVGGGSWIVHTPRGMIGTKRVLLTTNGYTSHLLPHFRDLIVPVRGEMSSLVPPPTMKPGSSNPPFDYSYGFVGIGQQNEPQDDYLIQRPYARNNAGGELMFGGGRSYAAHAGVGVSDDSSIDLPAAEYLRTAINTVVDIKSEQKELQASYEWSGIMGYSRDERPWVGEVTEDLGLGGGTGLWVSAGFTGHGMPNAFLSGKAAVDMILGKKGDEVDLPHAYRLSKDRVREARMLDEVHVAHTRG
ncbi:FAD dependent oxidoreductase [Drepanopeziza brunnea f. sp. 'multigermtubi' MB_m1]|uniref:FAD dependent oxidoreductase n=1 Tax=Marssonina brunnea f. sp. multigermtubi (strain MB_m1) TaxID=1072389 RepID=K1WTA5_MARBU|nr:FAD dependent oxidoreductase [Drepanopeziza brunnea f. sp. 'multigermtubi' MB_m1]EKD20895.1 FAD dependent oxidoreductase [Drepanopeziza brunnea f. sp. 'multigermtubi' MB_m1]